MQRRTCLAGGLLAAAQQPLWAATSQAAAKLRRVGVLGPDLSYATDAELLAEWQAFVAELARLGHVEGRDLAFVRRFGEAGRLETLDLLAAELVRLQVDVIFAVGGTASALAAKRATATLPIVFNSSADPVAMGLVASLARPGGNLTGNSILNSNLAPKSMQLLAEAAGKLTSVADLQPQATRKEPWFDGNEAAMRAGAAALAVRFQFVNINAITDVEAVLRRLASQGVDGVIVDAHSVFLPHLRHIADLLIKHRLPSIGDPHEGFLLNYYVNWRSLAHSSASYVDRLLKGAKPADLPVQQATRFDLVINLKTAKALGITIPQALLLRADEVIQ